MVQNVLTQTSPNKWSYLSLFTSVGTLLCCALPSLLVLLGFGATVASVLSTVPWLVMLSRHKNWVFFVSGLFITGNFFYVYKLSPNLRAQTEGCDSNGSAVCGEIGRLSRSLLWVSAALYTIGFFTAFVLGPLLIRFGD